MLSNWQKTYVPHEAPAVKDGRQMLSGGQWRLQRASEVQAKGEEIASTQFDCDDWIPATVPGTVLASYLNIGAVPDPNYADNVDQISEPFFRSNFWYRNEFEVADLPDGPQQWLHFDGIIVPEGITLPIILSGNALARFFAGMETVITASYNTTQKEETEEGVADVSALTKPIYTAIDIVRNRAFYDEARQNPLPKLFRDKREDRKKDDAPQAINNDNTEKAS